MSSRDAQLLAKEQGVDLVEIAADCGDVLLFLRGIADVELAKAPPYPVLWVLTKDGKPPAPWGALARFAP